MIKASLAALLIFAILRAGSQNPPLTAQTEAWRAVPEISVQDEDYSAVRKRFHTKLLTKGPAPEQTCPDTKPPRGVSEVIFPSGTLRLKAWISRAEQVRRRKSPAVLFLHGGFCFDFSDWQVTQVFRNAGFVVMIPVLRGEQGLPGDFTMFYDEVDDVKSAADYLRHEPRVDSTRLYLAGHSTGGTLTMLWLIRALLLRPPSRGRPTLWAIQGTPWFRAATFPSTTPIRWNFRCVPRGCMRQVSSVRCGSTTEPTRRISHFPASQPHSLPGIMDWT